MDLEKTGKTGNIDHTENSNKKPKRRLAIRILAGLLVLILVVQTVSVVFQTRVSFSSSDYEGTTKEHAAETLSRLSDYLDGSVIKRGITYMRRYTGNTQGYLSQASVAIGKEDYVTAIEQMRKAIDVCDPSDFESLSQMHLQQGCLEIMIEDYDAAVLSLTHCIGYTPEESNAYYLRAQAYMELGDLESSVADVLKYDELTGQDPEIEASFGALYEAAGEYERAIACYSITIDTPSLYDREVLVSRGRCRVYTGDSKGAIEDLERYLIEGGQDEEYDVKSMLCALYLEANEYGKAAEMYEKACEAGLTPSIEMKNWIGMAYMGTEEYEKAVTLFREVMEEAPDYEGTAYYLALCAYSLENFEEAESAFTRAIENEEEVQFCYYYRAICRLQLNKVTDAAVDLEMAVHLGGDDALTSSAQEMLDMLYEE